MNRGTALKWIAEIESGKYNFGNGQLSFSSLSNNTRKRIIHHDAIGVLANFLDPMGWKSVEMEIVASDDFYDYKTIWTDYYWYGELCFLPDFALKRCKIKSRDLMFTHPSLGKTSFIDCIDNQSQRDNEGSWKYLTHIIENHYEEF